MSRRPTQLPGGRHGLSRSFVISNQRERMLAAVADTVAEKGYVEMTVADVLKRAGVSRRTFYDHFADKREAFFAAFDASVQQVMLACAQAFVRSEHWPEQIRLAATAYLGYLSNDAPFTRMAIVEIPIAGPDGQARQLAGRLGFEVFLAPGAELAEHPVPAMVPKVVGSGIFEMLHARVVRGETGELMKLLPACVYHCIVPYLGIDVAVQEAAIAAESLVA